MHISSEPLQRRAVSNPAAGPAHALTPTAVSRRSLSDSEIGRRTPPASLPLSALSAVHGEAADNVWRASAGRVVGNQAREDSCSTECQVLCARSSGQCIPAEPRGNEEYPAGEAADGEEQSWPGGEADGSNRNDDERARQNAMFEMMRAQQQHMQQLLNMMRKHVSALAENAQKQITEEQRDRLRLMQEAADLSRAAAA